MPATLIACHDCDLLQREVELHPGSSASCGWDARRTFANAERTLATDSPLQQEMREALREVSRAAASVRGLTDLLERQPESLIRGRKAEESP